MKNALDKFSRRPRIAILADRPGWAFDISAQKIRGALSDFFDIHIYYVISEDHIDRNEFDLLHVCFWGETYHSRFGFPPEKVVKEISSHRWQYDPPYGPLSPEKFVTTFLSDAGHAVATSKRLCNFLRPYIPELAHVENGFDTSIFYAAPGMPTGAMRIAWAGNAKDPIKGVEDILKPAASDFTLSTANGDIPHEQMAELYQRSDIYVVCSLHEAGPLPLIESMACGCFPVCCDVGIVPELVRHKDNGFIVAERTVAAFREAFLWCAAHIDEIRTKRAAIAGEIKEKRAWNICVGTYKDAWNAALRKTYFPVFRNDDVAPDTQLEHFRKFCSTFHEAGFTQVHAVTLSGQCNVVYDYGGVPSEYPGLPPICFLSNEQIRVESQKFQMEDAVHLVAYLNSIPDELAFHGTAHVDFSRMTEVEQQQEFREGLERMRQLFPEKTVRYFVPPFNRINRYTEPVANSFGLRLMKTEGIHLEEQLADIDTFEHQEYRYHHHRFYPESKFNYYTLNIELLKKTLQSKVSLNSKPVSKINKINFIKSYFNKKIFLHIKSVLKHTPIKFLYNVIKQILKTNSGSSSARTGHYPFPLAVAESVLNQNQVHPWHLWAYKEICSRQFNYDFLLWTVGNMSANAEILEAGSGAGQNLYFLSHKGFRALTGVEIDKNAYNASMLLKEHANSAMQFINADITTFNSDRKFDLIFCFDVLYLIHGYTYEKFISKCRNFLSEDGFIAFDAIDISYNSTKDNIYCTQDWNMPEHKRRQSEYLTRHSYKEIETIAHDNNLRIIFHKFYPEIPQRSVYILKNNNYYKDMQY